MVAVPVKGEVLVWARTERGLTPALAAERLGISESALFQLERGENDLTLGDLERIAQRYQLPLASLLMPAPLPPVGRPKLRDFRAFEGAPASDLAPETLLAIEEAYGSLELLEELREAAPLLFHDGEPPEYTLRDDPENVAKEERTHFGVTVAEQFTWPGDREAFLRWREVIEAEGVFTYQLPLGPDDSRGFAIWDERRLPVIVIDSADEGYPARIFTLLHEYAHILLRMGGISNQNRRNSVERFCNQFAAYFLMPREDFTRAARLVSVPGANSNGPHL
jgi:transcriptional regulator with XRE-family HTH domain